MKAGISVAAVYVGISVTVHKIAFFLSFSMIE